MKKIITVLLFITFFCLYKCHILAQKNTLIDCDSIFQGKAINTKVVDVFEIDTSFHYYLDTIIANELKYNFYNECYSGFLFSISLVQSYGANDFDEILIGSINKYLYDYSRCYGIFEYKGKTFICDSLCDHSLLHFTNRKTSIQYFVAQKYLWQIDIDDRYSIWYFYHKDNKIIPIGHYYP